MTQAVTWTEELIYCLSNSLCFTLPSGNSEISHNPSLSLSLWLTAGISVLPAVCLFKISRRVAYLILKCPVLLLNDYEDHVKCFGGTNQK